MSRRDDGRCSNGFLRLHELALEQVDQDVSLTGSQGVLAELDDGTLRRGQGDHVRTLTTLP